MPNDPVMARIEISQGRSHCLAVQEAGEA